MLLDIASSSHIGYFSCPSSKRLFLFSQARLLPHLLHFQHFRIACFYVLGRWYSGSNQHWQKCASGRQFPRGLNVNMFPEQPEICSINIKSWGSGGSSPITKDFQFNYLMVIMATAATNHHFTHETFSIHKQQIWEGTQTFFRQLACMLFTYSETCLLFTGLFFPPHRSVYRFLCIFWIPLCHMPLSACKTLIFLRILGTLSYAPLKKNQKQNQTPACS